MIPVSTFIEERGAKIDLASRFFDVNGDRLATWKLRSLRRDHLLIVAAAVLWLPSGLVEELQATIATGTKATTANVEGKSLCWEKL